MRGNVRVRIIGKRDRLPAALREALAQLEDRTRAGFGHGPELWRSTTAREPNCAMRSGRWRARSPPAQLEPDAIDDEAIAGKLTTAGLPDPDLLIRTGGELRLSNFLLYQCAYTELWSTLTPWPEFDGRAFDAALAAFAGRQRRFGR